MNYDAALPGDQIWIDFPTYNGEFPLWKPDLGQNFGASETARELDCYEP
jgi:hypothetical protein